MSPLLFVTPDDPPTLLIHGDADELVPLSHSERILAALRENRVTTELILLQEAGHAFRGAHAEAATAAMVARFDTTLLQRPATSGGGR